MNLNSCHLGDSQAFTLMNAGRNLGFYGSQNCKRVARVYKLHQCPFYHAINVIYVLSGKPEYILHQLGNLPCAQLTAKRRTPRNFLPKWLDRNGKSSPTPPLGRHILPRSCRRRVSRGHAKATISSIARHANMQIVSSSAAHGAPASPRFPAPSPPSDPCAQRPAPSHS